MGAVTSGDCNEIEIPPYEYGKHREFMDAANFRGLLEGKAEDACVSGFSDNGFSRPLVRNRLDRLYRKKKLTPRTDATVKIAHATFDQLSQINNFSNRCNLNYCNHENDMINKLIDNRILNNFVIFPATNRQRPTGCR